MTEKKYKHYCKYCKKDSIFFISSVSKNKGVKITDLSCSRESKKWINYNLLVEYDFEKETELTQVEIDKEKDEKEVKK